MKTAFRKKLNIKLSRADGPQTGKKLLVHTYKTGFRWQFSINIYMPLSIYESNNLFVLKENIFDLNEYLFGPKIFCLDYQMLFNSNKSFV